MVLVALNEAFLQAIYIVYHSKGMPVTIAGYTYGLWEWCVIGTLPVFLLKQWIGVIQTVHGVRTIVNYDEAERLKNKKE